MGDYVVKSEDNIEMIIECLPCAYHCSKVKSESVSLSVMPDSL